MHRIQLLFSMIALFIRIELLCISVHRLPPNRAKGVAVFEDSPIRYNNAYFGFTAFAVGAGGGCLDALLSIFFLPLSGRRPVID